jgi:hypothetical protein
MKQMFIARHGDILIRGIDKLPVGLKKIDNPILAYGEATGHHHKLVKEREQQFDIFEDSLGNKYLQINEPTDLVHEEHKKITIEKGFYFIDHEQEYNYFELQSNRVQD